MPQPANTTQDAPLYRIDKFIVPDGVRQPFLARIHATHQLLRNQPGFLHDLLLEQIDGPGEFNLVTLVAWKGQADMEGARKAVQASWAETGFDPRAFLGGLGIRGDLATYQTLAG